MSVNIGTMTYGLEMLVETGVVYDLSDLVISMVWQEGEGEIAQRGTFTLVNSAMGTSYLHAMAKIGCVLLLYADWGQGRTLLYQGRIWDWQYRSEAQKELTITTYDDSKFLMQSKDSYYFSSGMDTKSLLQGVCKDCAVDLDYQWGQSMTHEKKSFRNESIATMVLSVLEEVSAHCGEKFLCIWENQALTVKAVAGNALVYVLDTACTVSTAHGISMENLLTRVKVLGTADDEGRSSVEAVVEGDLSYGLLQDVLVRDSDKTLEEAIAEAETYLQENCSPKEEISVVSVDLPFLRKGDAVYVKAGDFRDGFVVLGVCHDGTRKLMTLTLRRMGEVIG